MKIGNIDIKGNVLLAPMCDVTSMPFRILCKRYGAGIVYTEMINAEALVFGNEKTIKRASFLEEERPFGIQLSGANIKNLVAAAKKAEQEIKPDLIDINFGCPAYHVMKTGSGAATLKELDFLKELVTSLSQALTIPLTCKMRILSTDEDTLTAAKIIEESGAAALTIHGRTARQMYSGVANWNVIQKIKQELSIPVIINGDITDGPSAKKALETGCDALMIGRAAIGNPFVFKQVLHFLETGEKIEQTNKEKLEDFIAIADLCRKHEYLDIKPLKMLAQNMIRGNKGAKKVRMQLTDAKNVDDVQEVLQNFLG